MSRLGLMERTPFRELAVANTGTLDWRKMTVGGTVKRLVVCSLCGPATVWSDALFHSNRLPCKPAILFYFYKMKQTEVNLCKESHKAERYCYHAGV